MANLFSMKIIAANRQFFSGRARCVIIPTRTGQRAVLANHEEMTAAIDIGELSFCDGEENWTKVAVGPGILQTANNRVTILVDSVETREEIDIARAEEALARAQEELRQKQSIDEYRITQAALARALTRLRLAGERKEF